jgi:hypothetical protein
LEGLTVFIGFDNDIPTIGRASLENDEKSAGFELLGQGDAKLLERLRAPVLEGRNDHGLPHLALSQKDPRGFRNFVSGQRGMGGDINGDEGKWDIGGIKPIRQFGCECCDVLRDGGWQIGFGSVEKVILERVSNLDLF